MKTGPINLICSHFTIVNISANSSAKDDDVDNIELEVIPYLSPPEDFKKHRSVILTVKIKSKDGIDAPYTGEVENIGRFSIIESWPEEQIEKLVYINGCGILYASIREMVTIITSRGFFPPLTLPSCSFAEMYREREEEKKKQAEAAMQPPLNLSSEPAKAMVSEKTS
jgi:preprotein translocase subunit SecB